MTTTERFEEDGGSGNFWATWRQSLGGSMINSDAVGRLERSLDGETSVSHLSLPPNFDVIELSRDTRMRTTNTVKMFRRGDVAHLHTRRQNQSRYRSQPDHTLRQSERWHLFYDYRVCCSCDKDAEA
jgi:hypothetical protein